MWQYATVSPYRDPIGTRRVLNANARLFDYIETLSDSDFAIEPYPENIFEMIPDHVNRQVIGFSSGMGGISLDIYFFPCDYSQDPKRQLWASAVRVPVAVAFDHAPVDELVKRYFPGRKKSAVIPFSFDRLAVLEGSFIDHYQNTERICRKAVKGGTKEEINNCERFLEFVKTVGKSGNI